MSGRYEWSPLLYVSAVGTGMANCLDHNGRHPWVMLGSCGPDDGFCMGLIAERIANRRIEPAPRQEVSGE